MKALVYELLVAGKKVDYNPDAYEKACRFIEGSLLNMEKALLKFQELMYEQYRQKDERSYETHYFTRS